MTELKKLEKLSRESEPEPELLRSTPVKRQRRNSKTAFVALQNPKDEHGISECFHKVSTSMYVSLAPVYTHNAIEGIKAQHLDPLIMTYFTPANGVVLAHYNLKLYGTKNNSDSDIGGSVMAKITYDSPFAFLWISVDLLVWKPLAGDIVEGWINLQSPSHIGLLIHDTFNATIKRDAIPQSWKFVPNQEDENQEDVGADEEISNAATEPINPTKASISTGFNTVSSDLTRSLGYWVDGSGKRIEGKLKFTVRHFNVSSRTVSVQGTLLEPGAVREDLTRMSSKKPRQSKKGLETEVGDEFDNLELPSNIVDSSPATSKKQKHISFADEPVISTEAEASSSSSDGSEEEDEEDSTSS